MSLSNYPTLSETRRQKKTLNACSFLVLGEFQGRGHMEREIAVQTGPLRPETPPMDCVRLCIHSWAEICAHMSERHCLPAQSLRNSSLVHDPRDSPNSQASFLQVQPTPTTCLGGVS